MKAPKYPHGRALRMARAALGLSSTDLADQVGIDGAAVSRFESGSSLPNIHRILWLLEQAGFTVRIQHAELGIDLHMRASEYPDTGLQPGTEAARERAAKMREARQ